LLRGTKRKQPATTTTTTAKGSRVRRSSRSATKNIFDDDDDLNDMGDDDDDAEEGEIYGRRGDYLDGDVNIAAIKDQVKRIKPGSGGRQKKIINDDVNADLNKMEEDLDNEIDLYDDSPEAGKIMIVVDLYHVIIIFFFIYSICCSSGMRN